MSETYPVTLDGWLSHIEACHPSEIELGLARLSNVASRLPIDLSNTTRIVVGGTNGKGSTLAMLNAILLQQGLSTGMYTSPHFLHYNERIAINGEPVSDAVLCEVFASIEKARGDTPLTYFEYGTLAALLVFSQQQVDVALLEVGLGGRLDAVNIVDADIAVVTTVALDHTDWLGPDRESIGFEKAGIFRSAKPALCGDPEAPERLIEHAKAIGATLCRNGIDYHYQQQGDGWCWDGVSADGDACHFEQLPVPMLPLANAALVLQILQFLPVSISEVSIREGLAHASLTGRMQHTCIGELPVILDVAHNPEAAAYLADRLCQTSNEPVHLVFGMLADKDIPAVIDVLKPAVDQWYPVSLAVPRGTDSGVLVAALSEAGVSADTVHPGANVKTVVEALQQDMPEGRVVIAGSFFTVTEALAMKTGVGC
ncbi:bifunctional tetrahydrofolate synthase/dihydrofolate synthase [Marinobacterium sediminicola]|uniref:Dihydrofolate synthase/folylpolyglutamate synthase n=1 Tax=Marinobacterium sediminicola TaxID=518898 RepID=A0ABY1RVI3_9GAMM|nr:bifunctional tetrahydrofolate synthase/dihydrofolate synthase [Marinobacterium sediminicola]ULG70635.1 bifunctional tetrahydrofolate synthase/dihydrofolate synthase [Marinobacterium sediminicola]SMR68799.1 dihydrofolate synthase / folylpolyglutamate synthase [Marinobacterium sediminicola]